MFGSKLETLTILSLHLSKEQTTEDKYANSSLLIVARLEEAIELCSLDLSY